MPIIDGEIHRISPRLDLKEQIAQTRKFSQYATARRAVLWHLRRAAEWRREGMKNLAMYEIAAARRARQ